MPASIATWRQTQFGLQITAAEEKEIAHTLAKYAGNHLVCLDPYISQQCLRHSKVKKFWYVAPIQVIKVSQALAIADYQELPLLSDAIDIVLAPHLIDSHPAPKTIIKEIWRTLAPEGLLIVSGFNKNSLFGLPSIARDETNSKPAFSPLRIRHLLIAQGFQIEIYKSFYYRPWVQNQSWQQTLKFMELLGGFLWPSWGGFYLMVARKPVLGVTPLQKVAVKKEKLPKGVLEPTTLNRRDIK